MSESSYNSGSERSVNYYRTAEEDVLEASNSLQTGIFGVLYTVSKEKAPSIKLVTFKLALEWLQLFLLAVNPQYGFNGFISRDNSAWYVISFVSLNQFLTERGYTFFLVCLYVMVVGLAVNVSLCLYVSNAFQANKFDAVWPIVVLRYYSLVFFQILEVASISFFLTTLDCAYFGLDNPGYNQEFGVYCWSMPHLVHAAVSALALAVFVLMAMLFTMAEIDTSPATRNPAAASHSLVEVLTIAIKALMTCACVFVTGLKWLAIVQFCLAFCLVYLHLKWMPHTYDVINMVRCASFSSIWYVTFILLLMAFKPGVNTNDELAVNAWNTSMTTAMWAGIVPSGLLGALACWMRLRYYIQYLVDRFVDAPAGTKSKLIFQFTDPRQVEVMMRCCRKWMPGWGGVEDEDLLDPQAVKRAEMIVKAGMAQLPKHPYMIILYSSFLIDVLGSYQTGYNQLQDAKKTDPSFMERFSVFSREQEHTQKETGAQNGENSVDLVSYVEFQRNHRLVIRAHKEALITIRTFWKILLGSKIKFTTLSLAIKRMDAAVKQAERVYRQVLARHMNSAKLLKLYSRFLFDVKSDPFSSAKWLAESEKLDQEEDALKDSEFNNFSLASLGTSIAVIDPLKLKIREDRAIIIINGSCTIQMTQGVGEMFGYTKSKELHGRNVSEIIPPPFADQHNSYVRSHVTTGRRVLLDRTSELVALRKDRTAFPVSITVTHLSGVGEDSMFMGVIEPRAVDVQTACAWVLPTGIMAGASTRFVDWFGYRPHELMGARLSQFLEDAGVIEGVIQDVQRQRPVQTARESKRDSHLVNRKKRRASISEFFGGSVRGGNEFAPQDDHVVHVREPTMIPSDRSGKVVVELADERLVEVEYHTHGNNIVIPGRIMRHKYADPVKVDVTVRRTAIGAFQVYCMSVQRQEPEQMLLASDRQGRVRYANQPLCKLLECSLPQLLQDNTPQAIDAILPEPFAQLHYQFRQDAIGPRPAHAQIPPRSCFAGMAVCLKTIPRSAVETSNMLPVRLGITFKELGPSDVVQSMKITPVTMQQALDERRLTLTLDAFGNVMDVGDSPTALFGFDPRQLKGKDVSAFLDIFQQNGGEALQGRLMVKDMLSALAERAAKAPGVSWRVGVVNPAPIKSSMANLGAITQAHLAQRTRPAVLTLKIRTTPPPLLDPEEVSNGLLGLLGESKPGSVANFDAAGSFSKQGSMSGNLLDTVPKVPSPPPTSHPELDSTERRSPPVSAAGETAIDKRAQALRKLGGWSFGSRASFRSRGEPGLLFEVELWASELMCCVLEVDGQGRLVGGGLANPLCPPGLVLGVGMASMTGHLSGLVPQMKDNTIQDLFAGKLGQVAGEKPKMIKQGSLKHKPGTNPRMDAARSVGQSCTLTLAHLGDGRSIDVMLQAVWRMGSQAQSLVIMRPVKPTSGREDFAQWLEETADAAPFQPLSRAGSMVNTGMRSVRQSMNGRTVLSEAAHAAIDGRREVPASPAVGQRASFSQSVPPATAPATLSIAPEPEPAALATQQAITDDDWALDALAKLNQDHKTVAVMGAQRQSVGAASDAPPKPLHQILHELQQAQAHDSSEPGDVGRVEDVDHGRKDLDDWLSDRAGGKPHGGGSDPGPELDMEVDDPWGEDKEEEEEEEDEEEEEEEEEVGAQGHVNAEHMEDEAGGGGYTDYKRGKRFKNLLKFFGAAQVTQSMSSFKFHMVLLTTLLFAAHVACFAVMLQLLQGVQSSVQDLYSSALANRKVYEIAINTRAIEIALLNKTDPNQPGLDDPVAVITSFVDDLDFVSTMFKPAHQGVYLGFKGFKRLPTDNGLRDLWDKPVINVTNFFDAEQGLIINYTMMGLWDLGNLYQTKARNLWTAATSCINSTDPKNVFINTTGKVPFDQLADYYFILTNGPNNLQRYYTVTLDDLMQVTVQASNSVNAVHLIIMAVEGVFLVVVTAIFVWKATQNVSQVRYDMYSCFIQIPQGMIRTLAEKKISLDGEEDEEDGMEVLDAGDAGQNKEASAAPPAKSATFAIKSQKRESESGKPRSSLEMERSEQRPGLWQSVMGFFALRPWQPPEGAGATKKRLETSNRAAWYMVTPFFVWGIVVMVVNSVNYSLLVPMSDAISLLNIVCAVLIRHHVLFFFSMDYVAENSGIEVLAYKGAEHLPAEYRASTRARFTYELDLFEREYRAMLYSGQSVGVDTPHFSMSKTGIATSENAAKNILYQGGSCLCEDAEDCSKPSSIYYAVTHAGLDAMMKEYFSHFRSLAQTPGTAANVSSPVYSYIISLGQADIEGGIVKLTQVYFNQLLQQYKSTEMLQIILLVFVAVIAIALIALMVFPFVQEVWVETRRIAELLSQLPSEINVEEIVANTIVNAKAEKERSKKPPLATQKSMASTAKLLQDRPAPDPGASDELDSDLKWAEAVAPAQAHGGNAPAGMRFSIGGASVRSRTSMGGFAEAKAV